MRIKIPRAIPALILGGALAVSIMLLVSDARARQVAAATAPARLAALQRAVAEPGATAADWRALAEALDAAHQYDRAAQAWQRTLGLAPYDSSAAESLAVALANAGDREALFEHLAALTRTEARAAWRALQRPEISRFADDPRHGRLLAEARSQAVD